MGMSSEIRSRYLSLDTAGQVAYLLDTSSVNLTQVQLAATASDILLIQEDDKLPSLPDNSILVADVGLENLNILGNNFIVLVSQPQEVIIVNSDNIAVGSAMSPQCQDESGSESATTLLPVAHLMTEDITTANLEDEWPAIIVSEPSPNDALEEAVCWYRDSVISTTALASLSTFMQSRSVTKDG